MFAVDSTPLEALACFELMLLLWFLLDLETGIPDSEEPWGLRVSLTPPLSICIFFFAFEWSSGSCSGSGCRSFIYFDCFDYLMIMVEEAEARPLFGGAIEAVIPPSFVDASAFRQIPDNQEVFVDVETDQSIIIELLQMTDEADIPARFHFNELVDANGAQECSRILRADELAAGSDLPFMDNDSQISMVIGQQLISKFREGEDESTTGISTLTSSSSASSAKNLVNIYLAVVRLPRVATDILVSYNHPIALGQASSSRGVLIANGARPEAAEMGGISTAAAAAVLGSLPPSSTQPLSSIGMGGSATSIAMREEVLHALAEIQGDVALENFKRSVSSLVIKDWNLFS